MPLIKTSYSNPWYIFWALVLANVIASFDWMFTSVALPTMASDFNLPLSRAAWIPLAGTLTIGALLLPTGSLADLFGRKRLQLFAVVLSEMLNYIKTLFFTNFLKQLFWEKKSVFNSIYNIRYFQFKQLNPTMNLIQVA